MALGDFASNAGAVVSVVQHPLDGSLYYISYNYAAAEVRQITYTGNRTPVAVASADQYYGPSPLAVQLSSSGSSDPDGQALTCSWNFGDGSPVSAQANPAHTFSAGGGVPTKYVVTLTVTDSGGLSAQTTLIVSVNNTPPNVAITSPVNGALYSSSNATSVNLTATVSDAQSSDSQLLYQWQVLLHHNDHNHASPVDTNHVTTATISPTGCDGVNIFYYRIILTVTDPAGLATTREVRLYPDCGANTPPVISAIANATIFQNTSTAPLPFTVGDAQTAAVNLQLSAASSNPALVPAGNMVFGGSGSNRTVTVTPVSGQTGNATITVAVNDGPNNTSTSFVVTVNASSTATASFTNAAPITIPDSGAASPYPSTINVSGTSGTISNVTVTLKGLSQTWASDVDVLLVGPTGQKLVVMSDAGSGTANNVTLTLSDTAAAALPASGLVSGTFRPTNLTDDSPGGDDFPAPAPIAPYGSTFATFDGTAANGSWSLYVFDDGPGDEGSFAGGWSLTVTTLSGGGSAAPTIGDIPDQSTTVNTPTPAIPFTINDADTPVSSLTLSKGSANPTLVPTNNIVFGGNGSNRTLTVTPAANQTGTATITVTVSDGTNSAGDAFVLTVSALKPPPTPPTITDIANQTINVNGTAGPLSFTIGDVNAPLTSLTLSAGSSNPTLVPTNNIVFGGSGSSRAVTVTPATGQSGTATITVSVSDGQLSASTSFALTVNPLTYPIKISSSNSRLLVDQSDVPFLLIADSPHSLIVNLNDADAAFYLADRGTNGFNSLWVELLCVEYTFGRANGSLVDEITTPFTGTLPGGYWDLTTPNEAYFEHVDKIVRMAGSNGLQILLTPLETGGLTDTAVANGTNRCRQATGG